jgi:hypothetical protein
MSQYTHVNLYQLLTVLWYKLNIIINNNAIVISFEDSFNKQMGY